MAEQNSRQTRELTRRIGLDTLKRWAIYTAAFLVVAMLLNATAFPLLGDWIADSTSSWRTLAPGSYSLQKVLDESGLRNDDGTYDMSMLATMKGADELAEQGIEPSSSMTLDFGYQSKYQLFYSLFDAIESGEEWKYQIGNDETYLVVSTSLPKSIRGAMATDSTGATYYYETFEDAIASPLFGSMTESEAAHALEMRTLMEAVERRVDELGLRDQVMENEVLSSIPLSRDSTDWQMMWDEYGALHYRDLSIYNIFHELKLPAIVALYFIGCIVIVLLALRKSLRATGQLTEAVGGMIANREQPVELPADLVTVQDELNNIRVSALADERAAVAAERRKDELVAYLAHDVKTPLTSVIGYLSLLDEAPDLPEEPRQKYTRIAYEKAIRLEGLIDEFFEITRYNLQAIPIERSWVSVKLFCEQVAEGFYVEAEARDLEVEVEAPDDARFFVDGDKLARALGNVVRNAIAYADAGTVVQLRAEAAQAAGEPVWRLIVTDRGREISAAHLKSIFDKFYREDSARGTREGGTGLGLAIAQEIAVAHKGSIEAASEEGVTTFTITLPRIADPLVQWSAEGQDSQE